MITEYFAIKRLGDTIWCAHDTSRSAERPRPLVVITPGYERVARDSLMLASYLVLNGFDVLRFDARNSVGRSSGEIESFSMSSFTDDIEAVLDDARVRFPRNVAPSVLAVSLSTRALARCLANCPSGRDVSVVLSIVGVVDTRYTISKITGEDNFTNYLNGTRYGVRKLLTYEIDWDNFLADAIGHHMDTLESSLEDARKISVPLWVSITTEMDEWVAEEHADKFLSALGAARVERVTITAASHKIWKNPRTARLSMVEVVHALRRHYWRLERDDANIMHPDVTDIVERNRAERNVVANQGTGMTIRGAQSC